MFSNFAKWLAKYAKLWPGCFLNMKFGMCQVCNLAYKTWNLWVGQKHFAETGFDLYKRNLNAHIGAKKMYLLRIHFWIFTFVLLIACKHPKQTL